MKKILAIILLFTFLGCTTGLNQRQELHFEPLELPVEPSFHRDAILLVNTVEETHPVFTYRGGALLPSYYRERRVAYVAETNLPMSRTDFIMATRRYVAALHDGHMGERLPFSGMFLDIPFTVRDNRLFNASDVEVLQIGGVEIQNIFAQIDRHFFAENEIYRDLNYKRFAGYESILRIAGADISNDGEVTLALSTGYSMTRFTRNSPTVIHLQADFTIEYRMIGDVFLIDLRKFEHDEPYLTNAVNAIEKAITNGTRHFIVDLRGNPGGDASIIDRFFEAMGITIPGVSFYHRLSPLAIEQGWLPSDDRLVETAPNQTTSNPNNVFISVLTDTLTASAATAMAAWVQDGNLGNIIGSPSVNAPSFFGIMLFLNLPYSGIDVGISFARLLRPDTNADQNTLWPDILVDSELALDRALQFFRKKE